MEKQPIDIEEYFNVMSPLIVELMNIKKENNNLRDKVIMFKTIYSTITYFVLMDILIFF